MGNLAFIIAVVILSLILLVYVLKYYAHPLTYYADMDFSQVEAKKIQIPVGDIEIHACLYLPNYAKNSSGKLKSKLPLVLLNPGWGMAIDKTILKQWAVFIALNGPYACLTYDFRGLGKTPGKKIMTPQVADDIPTIIDFGLE